MTENWTEDKEYMSYVEDLLATEEVQRLGNYIQHINSTRLEHCISVSYNSYKLAKRWNGDARATARAGLLHDLFYYDWRTTKFDEGSHAYMHPRIAARNAEKITDLSDLERDIIIKHMWGATIAPPKYKESYIVTMVDKYCAIKEASTPLLEGVKGKWAQYFGRKESVQVQPVQIKNETQL
ncbi:HD domain-containing protein [Enterococcus sp. BWB1-3]|uniref:HD domain-containing protein n=1 Tax=unclassified Enterococcus TaxID=2608891 RepID=UPI00192482C8|nr:MULTISPECIES: HD domain-containing protein [unclassified Enterococcus]MBL1230478.1 HD domain-containing protein [Enterococcus sp. BWB1-3]MCB5950857.1 HD domain-containing protein [Enterococcus sp. BWT-B8]